MSHRHASMDLLRSAAILLVVLAHTVLSYGAPSHLAPLQFGGSGVDLFFVLSGWLLGGQLFKESRASGRVDVRRFWLRRWLRTFPAYFAVLGLSVVQRYATKENVTFPLEYFLFVQNYFPPLEFFFISWSLAVEEQFYLVIAPLVALSVRADRRFVLALLIAALLIPSLLRFIGPETPMIQTHVRLDGCIAGVTLAFVSARFPVLWQILRRIAPALAFVALAVYILAFVARYHPEWAWSDPGKLALALLFANWVLFANSNDEVRRRFRLPGAHHVATRSYAMYLLHPETLALLERTMPNAPFAVYLFTTLVVTLILSEILYQSVELPFMNLRERYNASRSVAKAA